MSKLNEGDLVRLDVAQNAAISLKHSLKTKKAVLKGDDFYRAQTMEKICALYEALRLM